MSAFSAVVRKEFLIISRRPAFYIQMFILPAVLILLISFAFQNLFGSPRRLPLPVVDLDGTTQSAALRRALASTGFVSVSRQAAHDGTFTEDDAIRAFDRGRRPAVLVIPAGYGRAATSGAKSDLTLYTDPAQPSAAVLIGTAVRAAVDETSFVDTVVRLASAAGGRPPAAVQGAVSAGVSSFLTAPPLSTNVVSSQAGRGLPSPFEQTVPGFTMWFSATLSSYLYFILLQERREWGVGALLAAAPVPRWLHLAAKAAVAYVFGALQFAIMFALAHIVFGMELGSIGDLALVIGAFLFIPVGVGVAVGGVARTVAMGDSVFGVWANIAPLVGGLLVPVFLLPRALADFARVSPYYWAIDAVQGVIVRGRSLSDLWLDLVVMLGCGAVLVAAGLPGFNYEPREAGR